MDVYRTGLALASVAGVNTVQSAGDTVIIPDDGQGLLVHGIGVNSDLAGGNTQVQVLVQKSTDTGATFATVFSATLSVARGQLFLNDDRGLYIDAARQAPGSTALQYRLAVAHSVGVGATSNSFLSGVLRK